MLQALKKARRFVRVAREKNRLLDMMKADFHASHLSLPALKITFTDNLMAAGDIRIRRDGQGYDLHVSSKTNGKVHLLEKVSAFIHWFRLASPEISEILVDCTDGEGPSFARYAYSVNRAGTIALPDVHFTRANGYAAFDQQFRTLNIPWEQRHNKIVWRGALNGMGHFNLDPAFINHPGVKQRLRMAQHCRNADIDFRFVSLPWFNFDTALQSVGLLADPIPALDWGTAKFGVDIDGFTNAWSNFMQRLKLGCCVLKVESQFGFRQWYYDQIQPWVHYVPIKADMSDLQQQIDWVRSNDAQAAQIAANGQRFAAGLTMETQSRVAAQLINAAEGVA